MSAFGICLELQLGYEVNFIAEQILRTCGEK